MLKVIITRCDGEINALFCDFPKKQGDVADLPFLFPFGFAFLFGKILV